MKIDELTQMVEDNMDDFYNQRARFKGLKAFFSFSSADYNHKGLEIGGIKPKMKKKQRANIFHKPNKNSLF